MHGKRLKYAHEGKILISQAVVMKTLGADTLKYELKKNLSFSEIIHSEYGYIDTKYSSLKGVGLLEGYKFQINKRIMGIEKRECDTFFFLGFDHDWKNIDMVLIIPNKGWISNIRIVSICKATTNSKYHKFITNAAPYNNTYHSLMSLIGKNLLIGIDDIEKWLKNVERKGQLLPPKGGSLQPGSIEMVD